MCEGMALATPLSNGEIGFYTATATAIPVLLVAYAVSVRGWVNETILPRVEQIGHDRMHRMLESIRDIGDWRKAARAASGTLLDTLYQIALLGILAAAALLPAAGEVAALAALLNGSKVSGLQTMSEIGIIAAGVVVLFPLVIHVAWAWLSSTPYVGIGSGITLTPLLAWLCTQGRASRVIDPDVNLLYVEHDGIRTFRGVDRMSAFSALAWSSPHQQPNGLQFINEREVLLFNRAADSWGRIGATRYERRWFKIVRLVAYADAEDARVTIAQERDAQLDE